MQQLRLVGKQNILIISAFTLIEVITVIAVIAILITLSLPGIGSLSADSNSAVYANMLVNTLSEAREKAIQLKRNITVCSVAAVTVNTNSDITIPACINNSTAWNSWVSYIDPALNPGSTTQLLSLNGNITANSITASSSGSLVFNYLGLVQVNGVAQVINFSIAAPGCRGTNGRQITLNANGTIIINNIGC
jgi:type IV fimbrial biogenesis protein FimT